MPALLVDRDRQGRKACVRKGTHRNGDVLFFPFLDVVDRRPAFRAESERESSAFVSHPNELRVGYVAGFEDLHGAEAVKHFAATERQAIPDLKNTIEEQVAEGEKVVTRYGAQGTHSGETEAFGPPTGNRIDIAGMVIDRAVGGEIVQSWIVYDALGDDAAARVNP